MHQCINIYARSLGELRLLQRDVGAELEQGALAGHLEEEVLSPLELGGEQDRWVLNPTLHWCLERGGDGTLWAHVSLTLSEQQHALLMAREAGDSDNPPHSHLSPALKTLWQCPTGTLRQVLPGLG